MAAVDYKLCPQLAALLMNWWNWFWNHPWWNILEEALQGDHNTVTIDYTKTNNTPMDAQNVTPIALTMAQKIYGVAKTAVINSEHLTLNNNVPPEVGCAEAVSTVLLKAGIKGVPVTGFAGTAVLYNWLRTNPQFVQITNPEAGAIIVSPTGAGNGKIPGHTGIVGAFGVSYASDWGICSNDSNSGLFLELWNIQKWIQYYAQYGGLPMYYFRAV